MALSQYNVKIELREILLKDRPQELLRISPKGTVPVLQLINGEVIDESLNIVDWVIKNNNSDWNKVNYAEQKKIIILHYYEMRRTRGRGSHSLKHFIMHMREVTLMQ